MNRFLKSVCLTLLGLSLAHASSYWDGTQLNNQARLGQPFNGFETDDPAHKPDRATSAGYATQVHGRRVGGPGGDAENALLDFGGEGAERFLSVSRLEDGGRRFTLKLQVLFEENTAEYRPGSIAMLDRLSLLLKSAENEHIQLVFTDTAGAAPDVQDLHVERVESVLSYLTLLS